VQPDLRGQLHRAVLLGRVSGGRGHREDQPPLTEAHPADQHWLVGVGKHDHVADVDVADQDQIFHK
jgi:hypothetical protein